MALINRRSSIAGVAIGSALCLVCGLPFIAALLGISGLSFGAALSNLPLIVKLLIPAGSVFLLLMVAFFKIRKRSQPLASKAPSQ